MLRNRSRAVSTKQALMADHTNQSSSQIPKFKKPISSIFNSSKFRPKGISDFDFLTTPSSVRDPKPFFSPKFPQTLSGNKQFLEKFDIQGIGLVLETIEENSSEPENKKVLFSSQLRIKIPAISRNYGIQTGRLSAREMELSEDYTCVIFHHGPNQRTTHIFDNYILESYFTLSDDSSNKNFLSFCSTCQKNLDQKNDIFIYRGEKAFCSPECRYEEMLLDGMEK